MKKAILTFGLFSMVMVLTSFTNNVSGGQQLPVIQPSLETTFDIAVVGQQMPTSKISLELELEPGGNGQQVPKQKQSLE